MANKKILVIAPHPDDETLGCGGTLLNHISNGDSVFWLMVTNIKEEYGYSEKQVSIRQEEIDSVSLAYGFEKYYNLDIPTTKLDQIPFSDLIADISRVIKKVCPEIIYLPSGNDVHTDHQIVSKATFSCTKNFRYPFIKKILMYETLSETEFAPPLLGNAFQPNLFVDVTEFFENKSKIMQLYSSEVMQTPLPRSVESIEALAKYRGSRIGVRYAEAYMLLFEKQ